jgi:hypothetical protein
MSSLPGVVSIVLLFPIVLTYPLSRLLLRAYRSEVKHQMSQRGLVSGSAGNDAGGATEEVDGAAAPKEAQQHLIPFPGSRAQLLRELRHAPLRGAGGQGVVAAGIALFLALVLLTANGKSLNPLRVVTVGITLLWPGVLTFLLTAGIARQLRWRILAGAAAAYVLIVGLASAAPTIGRAVMDAGTLWLGVNLPPTVILATLLTRRIRAVGPMVFLVLLIVVGTPILALQVLVYAGQPPTPVRALLVDVGLSAELTILGLMLGVLIAAIPIGIALLRLLARAYARYRISDDGVVLVALWSLYILIFSSFYLLWNDIRYFVLGLAALPMYLVGTWVVGRLRQPNASVAAPRLLWLRVFADKGPVSDLFYAVSRHWRHIGPMVTIGAWDLADVTIEPDTVTTYLRGKLHELFVRDPAAVRRLEASVLQRDPRGRFRCQQLFCFDDVWKPTVKRLIGISSIVVVDLRPLDAVSAQADEASQAPTNERGIFVELEALCALGAMGRTIVIHDGSVTTERQLRDLRVDVSSAAFAKLGQHEPADMHALLALLADRCVTQST